MRLVFLGSPPFATPVLARLAASRHRTLALVTPPDRPSGRGRALSRSPLASLAEERGIPVLRPGSTKEPAFLARLAALEPELLLVVSYGEILRAELFDLPPHGSLNVHASLLPRWRGASPIQRAILAGDAETGVSVQRVVRALDRGDVLLERRTPIGPEETAGELAARLAELGGEAALEALDLLEAGRARFLPQDEERATLAPKLAKEDGRIDWSRPAVELARQVRAMNPWPGARTRLEDGRELIVLRARALEEGIAGEPGTVARAGGGLCVQAGAGLLELLEVKPAGRGAMQAAAFLRGARIAPGARFGGAEDGEAR